MDDIEQAIKVNDLMHKKAGEMIELMKLARVDALKKKRLYMQLKKAVASKDRHRIRGVCHELATMKKLKFKF